MAAGADLLDADAHFLFLAEAHLGRDIGPRDGERAGLAAAAVVLLDRAVRALFISVLTTVSGSCFFIGEWQGS